jgi:hypothetical protein
MIIAFQHQVSALRVGRAAILLFLLGGCSRPDSGSAGSAASEGAGRKASAEPRTYQCDSLITPGELDRIAGVTGTKRSTLKRSKEEEEMYGVTYCEYYLTQALTFTLIIYDEPVNREGAFAFAWNRAKSEGGESFPGVGDAALLERQTVAGTVLLVRAKELGIIARMGDVSEGKSKLDKPAVLKRVTTTIIERL